MARKFFVGGNLKMNGTLDSIKKLVENLNNATLDSNTEVVIAPPALYLIPIRDHLRKEIELSAQDAYTKDQGAFTGEVSAWQLSQAQIPWTIIGHSERRSLFAESDEAVAEKTLASISHNLKVIFCIGESLEEREANKTEEIVFRQLKAIADKKPDWSKLVIAYEPVWAIGTGKVATPQQAQDVHAALRKWISSNVDDSVASSIRIVYGGSVNGGNAAKLATEPDIDGFLVGGASLKPEFVDIVNANHSKTGKL
ncbi:uncharacterized protein L969DRAFT_84101 [Mixia osmundae IAM 14324]|uniref:Triosephosphate isomerase n=1 Tax=Mixia osmundae (strain CBS 9802 / IAM 14324 / JCM 22182 / KY 12970) TaxID=764103 RepID=G7E089_MIXOS|nr:uncharacterized protein L969DRAFT_84101 [Mixia osmundae IAM 14324]KEI42239.1 hypothetical protein L969DRAFT_84101 [Mixia osmundae IAM 14324]GAA96249.1 hypothetical protein E5Q_02913 [Mixia osmundae IAM 14324]